MKKRSNSKIPVVVLFAPTASGKTALTEELFSPESSHFILNAEIISADSQSVYKFMDIGTAKPDNLLRQKIPHHIIDIVEPDTQFTVADFISLADKKCSEIYEKGKLPVVCGGTGFYIKNFLFGLPETPESDERIRNQLTQRIKQEGNEALYAELQLIDPESAAKIHVNDAYRICRALEIFYSTGRKKSDFELSTNLRENYDFTFIVLEPPHDLLNERIRQRVDIMIKAGLEEEVHKLVDSGFSKESPGMKAIGYAEWFLDLSRDEIIKKIKTNSIKYAKKQYTYIRDIKQSTVIPYDGSELSINNVYKFLQNRLFYLT